jgi:two-component system response regulator AtoC
VDVRFVAATHRPLEEMIARGEFREDLFYRLNVVPLWLPPLRDRGGDIAQLARRFCAVHGGLNGQPGATIDDDAIAALEQQPWPGNVRQLENFVERLVVLADGPRIRLDQVRAELGRKSLAPPRPLEDSGLLNLDERRRLSERTALTTALQQARNNRTVAARLLGVSRRTLYTKLEEHGLL